MSAPARKRVSLSQSAHSWQQAMREAITDADTLFERLQLPADQLPGARRAARLFPLRVPSGYVDRMARGDLADPLLRQVLPLDIEHAVAPGFTADAVGDGPSDLGDGVLHKYAGRALLITTGACAVHCRYCFRRHFDYAAHHAGGEHGRAAVAHIAADTSIHEVILSGGDPLSLSNTRLAALGRQLDEIRHVERLRLHTRTAVVLPERIDDGLVAWIASRPQRVVLVVHANHAREIDDHVAAAMARLSGAGAVLLNQAVLLRGVNDDAATLAALSERLFSVGVMPYYLHMLDRVAGTAHFEVDADRAQRVLDELAARLPGYLVPRLARETAGEGAKQVFGHRASAN
ncbi:EF-P beta-lysylation protein EpmB [Salinisphaera aquimarina]|uniref:L-lysine 2,3-aminomutase n=1 Tax=Salinisphaera aquimarina TaxID=2094031 RepID=A0ABV7EVL6_9GAMM